MSAPVTLDVWTAYVATVVALMITPGPSHLLMLSNSMSHGFSRAWATGAGDLSANTLQIVAAGAGLAGLIIASEHAFMVVKWAGVVYLVWLGARKILSAKAAAIAGTANAPRVAMNRLWWQGFITSAANPKAVVFFAALFPLFLDPARPLAAQILVLGATYILIDGAFLAFYGLTSSWLARRIAGPLKVWLERASGAFLILAAVLLAFKRAQAVRREVM